MGLLDKLAGDLARPQVLDPTPTKKAARSGPEFSATPAEAGPQLPAVVCLPRRISPQFAAALQRLDWGPPGPDPRLRQFLESVWEEGSIDWRSGKRNYLLTCVYKPIWFMDESAAPFPRPSWSDCRQGVPNDGLCCWDCGGRLFYRIEEAEFCYFCRPPRVEAEVFVDGVAQPLDVDPPEFFLKKGICNENLSRVQLAK